jgi:predicted RNA binding protein YcfA (HicA-like mRNA interferase family)
MGTLPQISGKVLVKFLEDLGYKKISRKGSHIKFKLFTESGTHTIIVPNHNPIALGTLNDILNKVSFWTNKSKNELMEILK